MLIAGLGPGHLEKEDLIGSGMDPFFSDEENKEAYLLDGINHHPSNLVYKATQEWVLKKIKQETPELISSVLINILKNNNVEYEHIPIKLIWDNSSKKLLGKVVCLSTSFMWSENMINRAINWIKKNIKYDYLIVGGQYCSLKKNYLIENHKEIDFIITGDAEVSLPQLLEILKKGKLDTIVNIPNLLYKKGDKFCETYSLYEDINKYDCPKFENNHQIIPYTSMRGCPYSCKFCALRFCTPGWRYLSAERIIKDWKYYSKTNNAKHMDIYDSTFFIPFQKIKTLLKKLPSMNLTWEANSRVDTPFNKEVVKELEKANCIALYFGFESMSNKVLGYMDKKVNSNDNRKINKLFKNSEIDTMMSFIVGFPGETISEFEKTKNYLLKEHYGYYNIYVFEFEDKSMPIWEDKDKFKLQIFNDNEDKLSWKHGGESWTHSGMDSETAKKLRKVAIKEIRKSNSKAIHRSWQYDFEWPLIKSLPREKNLKIEKLIDKLVFVVKDYSNDDKKIKIKEIVQELKDLNIHIR
ncbi:radical SAM protein [Candidatus Woesearchaeota archaeon]|nr:radical SAM protein [Candidatus Woesearchaeota archaeon]